MANIIKKPYEISLWDDVLTFEIKENGETKFVTVEEFDNSSNKDIKIEGQFYDEEKIANIGSDKMTAPWRAINPIYTRNVNGSGTLTFTLYSKYYDDYSNQLLDNPFIKKMVNERKVKLFYDGEWYDFVIKNVQENSENNSFTYTCKDCFVNELSKNGYNLTFNTELENNSGTVEYLAEKVLEGSDWKLKSSGESFVEFKEEPLYKIRVASDFIGTSMKEGGGTINVKAGTYLYGFYSCVVDETPFFQFLYGDNFEIDDNRVITNCDNYYVIIENFSSNDLLYFEGAVITSDYRGKKRVRKIETKYDPVTDKIVTLYKNKMGESVYGYTETEYMTSKTVENYLIDSSNFTSVNTNIWKGDAEMSLISSSLEEIMNENFYSYLRVKLKEGYLVNNSITEHRSSIRSFSKDEEYTIHFKIGRKENGEIKWGIADKIRFYIAAYEFNDEGFIVKVGGGNIFDFGESKFNYNEDTKYYTCTTKALKNLTYEEMLKRTYGLVISFPEKEYEYLIEDIQLFKTIRSDSGEIIFPNTTVEANIKTKYYYYKPNSDAKSVDEIEFLYKDYSPNLEYIEVYDEKCEKKRTITVSESNRFNILQSLCETFECWAKFTVEHEPSGKIKYDTSEHRQLKWVSFHEYIGKDNYLGFKYGINLKSIQRTLESDGIVTKLIVKPNSNQYAEGGFCGITTASENLAKENFLLDLSYYFSQGLLDFEEFNNDLYLELNGYLGYYQKLRRINRKLEKNNKQLTTIISKTLPQLSSQVKTYQTAVSSGRETISNQKRQLEYISGMSFEELIGDKGQEWRQQEDIYGQIIAIKLQEHNVEEYNKILTAIENNEKEIKNQKAALEEQNEELVEEKIICNEDFYKKYSHFIQEGAWTSENYIDSNLYYLDAESTLHTSSQPKVTYTINVVEVSQLEGLELYFFKPGDKTFIQDTEFFGWVDEQTPYREEVIVSEVKYALDTPEQNTITIKNYKTQFEDLFQRIAAITTAVQFSTGDFQKAASVVEADGSIKADVLQNSFAHNSIVLSNSNNESIVWNESGITTTSLNRPNEMVRIVGGGIFLSNDFGSTWTTGITGNGINASYLTAGQIDVEQVRVLNGSYPTFRWDKYGLSAYKFREKNGALTEYSSSDFIRFDQYGLYGIKNISGFDPNKEENGKIGEAKIQQNADFYLTWSGFGLKTNRGAVSITSDNDIQVFKELPNGENICRLKIGTLNENSDLVGMRLYNNNGQVTLETESEGNLFLKNIIKIAPTTYSDHPRVTLGPSAFYDRNNNLTTEENASYSKILSIKNTAGEENIIFYDNGHMVARSADITGTLSAGSIISENCVLSSGGSGNDMTVGQLGSSIANMKNTVDVMKGVKIESESGSILKQLSDGTVTPNSLKFNLVSNGIMIEQSQGLSVTWKVGSTPIERNGQTLNGRDLSITLTYSDIAGYFVNDKCYIMATYPSNETDKKYFAYYELVIQRDGATGADGQPGESAFDLRIESSNGFVINTSQQIEDTILTARVYQNGRELDVNGNWEYTWYEEIDGSTEPREVAEGKQISYSFSKFQRTSNIYYTVDILEEQMVRYLLDENGNSLVDENGNKLYL